MARTFDSRSLGAELQRARAAGWEGHMKTAERATRLPAGLLLAIASQETDMNDVVGDGGHGRGLFQIDDRSHAQFLGRHGAAVPGGKPPVSHAARYAADLLRWNFDYGARNGVREADRLKFALSAYNAGAGGAMAGYREGDSDRRTTGGNYAREVLRRHAIFVELLGGAPARPLKRGSRGKHVAALKDRLEKWYARHAPGEWERSLKRGSRGKHVAALKDRLEKWYARHAPGEWERFRVNETPLFGARVDRVVRDFQRRVGLEVDGIAGEDTHEALAENRRPKRR